MNYEITGSNVTKIEPVNGVIHYGGIIKSPTQMIRINWEIVGLPGATICQADCGQHAIDCLVKGEHKILSVELYK